GPDSFTYKAFDGELSSNVATVRLTITPVNDAPTVNDRSVTTNEDTAYSGTLTGSDVDGDALTFAKGSDPAHGTVSVHADGSFTYTPPANYNGPDSFPYKANDGTATSNPPPAHITVTPVNDPPTADAQSVGLDQDTSASITLTGSDVDGDNLTYQ